MSNDIADSDAPRVGRSDSPSSGTSQPTAKACRLDEVASDLDARTVVAGGRITRDAEQQSTRPSSEPSEPLSWSGDIVLAEGAVFEHESLPAIRAIAGYEIESLLGRGGMGVVYRARQTALRRTVALKMILTGEHADPVAQARFLIEAEAIAAVKHPHVVEVYDFGRSEGLPYFAMEFVGGGSLSSRLRESGPFAGRAAAEVVAKLAEGVAATHARGIIHRDLKSANVLITSEGEPKVSDFGLARVGQSELTASGAIMGTPSYMSPEQAAGRGVDASTDIYALGAILYDLLTGRPPFRGNSLQDTIQQVLTREPVRPRGMVATVPPDLETICLKCLEKEAGRRYAGAAELAADLRAFLEGRPITARPTGIFERAWKWTRRHPGRAGVLAASVIVTVGAIATWIEVRDDRARERFDAETKRLNDLRAADEKRFTDLRAERASALVEVLPTADTGGVLQIADQLDAYRDLAGPRLRELAKEPVGTKSGLHARLALVRSDPSYAAELAGYVPRCDRDELLPIREALRPHARSIDGPLWALATGSATDPGVRVRAAGLLAGWFPDDSRWPSVAPSLAEVLVKENPLASSVWADALAPVRGELLPALMTRYDRTRSRIRTQRLGSSDLAAAGGELDLCASLIARFASDRAAVLAAMAVSSEARHHRLFAAAIQANRLGVTPLLIEELGKPAFHGIVPPGGAIASLTGAAIGPPQLDPDPVFDHSARRRANAAAVLISIGEADSAWHLFRFPIDDDPSARSYLIERLAAVGVDPGVLMKRFRTERDAAARRALLIALGDYPVSALPPSERDAFIADLLSLYRGDPDAGLHSAIDWLLSRRWGHAGRVAAIDAKLASQGGVAKGRNWYVNGRAQTYVVIPGPVSFEMGSPGSEQSRLADETLHRKEITRTFAIATREVTVAEYRTYRPDYRFLEQYSPDADGPVINIAWYQAAAYCNWLSKVEGIPDSDWCYEPNAEGEYGEGMRAKPGFLDLKVYRLPTEAEWEYACRGGSGVSRPYGRGEELLPRYAWTRDNAADRAWPVGTLRPNDFGLFDSLGNVMEWVADPYADYDLVNPRDVPARNLVATKETSHVLRGGSYIATAGYVRSAGRISGRPFLRNNQGGFRPARTLSP